VIVLDVRRSRTRIRGSSRSSVGTIAGGGTVGTAVGEGCGVGVGVTTGVGVGGGPWATGLEVVAHPVKTVSKTRLQRKGAKAQSRKGRLSGLMPPFSAVTIRAAFLFEPLRRAQLAIPVLVLFI